MRSRPTLAVALVGVAAAAAAVLVAATGATSTAGLPLTSSAVVPPAPVVVRPSTPAAAPAPAARRAVPPAASRPAAHVRRAPAAPAVPAPVLAAAETPTQRGTRLLEALGYDWRSLGYRFAFLPGRPGLLGLTDPSRELVQVYVKDDESDLVLSHSIAHELGHVVDAVRGDDATRAAYLALRGLPVGSPWYGCARCTDFATPAGDWAEVFAAWLAGPGDFRSELAPAPTAAQLTELARLFTR